MFAAERLGISRDCIMCDKLCQKTIFIHTDRICMKNISQNQKNFYITYLSTICIGFPRYELHIASVWIIVAIFKVFRGQK